MSGVVIKCARCGKPRSLPRGHYNRSVALGNALYCGRKCASLAHRTNKTKAQLVAEKAEYDREYRADNRAMLKAKKSEYFKRTYDPVKAAVARKARMPKHVEYCRRPEYKRWKKQYDKQYRAEKYYGPFAEVAILTVDLNREIKRRMSNADIKWENSTSNKAQFRRRGASQEKERSRPRNRNRNRDHSPANS